ncbi:MFS transporter [Streptomyces brevispora]|uniref:Putative MFS family arabinose efflux permease n=1 Tax=Streptomyces brevispora TaxID=887462 RepID=A0A561UUA9_9ACTN|nr:MFS transporter [Streptomyces brevispora]TWG02948.1 putative MFS family arabinose efflux permease [Streptomyces brevispora]
MAAAPRTTALVVLPGLASAVIAMVGPLPGALVFAIREDFAFSASDVGFSFAGFYLASAVVAQFAGRLMARWSQLTLIRLGLALCAAVTVTVALWSGRWQLFAAAGICGAANGLSTPAVNLLIARVVPSHRRGLAFGVRMSAVPGGASLAALAAYFVVGHGHDWRAVYAGYAVLCLLTIAAMGWIGPSARSSPEAPQSSAPWDGPGEARGLGLLATAGLLAASGGAVLPPFLVEGMVHGGTTPGAAAIFLAVGSWLGMGARIVVGVVSDRLPRPQLHLTGVVLSLMAGSFGMLGLALGEGAVVVGAAAVVTFGLGWAWPGLLHHAAIQMYPYHLVRTTTRLQSGTFLGGLLGPAVFGLAVTHVSFTWAWLGSSVVMAFAAVAVWGVVRRSQAVPDAERGEGSPVQKPDEPARQSDPRHD